MPVIYITYLILVIIFTDRMIHRETWHATLTLCRGHRTLLFLPHTDTNLGYDRVYSQKTTQIYQSNLSWCPLFNKARNKMFLIILKNAHALQNVLKQCWCIINGRRKFNLPESCNLYFNFVWKSRASQILWLMVCLLQISFSHILIEWRLGVSVSMSFMYTAMCTSMKNSLKSKELIKEH